MIMRCGQCRIENPTWDHVAWHYRQRRLIEMGREEELELEARRHEQEERREKQAH